LQSKSEEPENTEASSPSDNHDSNVEDDSSEEQFEHSSKSQIKKECEYSVHEQIL
jgi:ribosomal 50S subunit-associated protein YjgA (DUF615 family)